jgi:hypothetical protein
MIVPSLSDDDRRLSTPVAAAESDPGFCWCGNFIELLLF